jgi:ankyrin repeat protein
MKYLKLFEDFDSYDPYELMIIPPNKKAEMIVREINKDEPNLNLVSDLIVLGADVNVQGDGGWTPLHLAVREGSVEIARMLIGAGADLNLQDTWGSKTPLHWAPLWGRVEIARMLIDAGANVNLQDTDGWAPLHVAAYYRQVKIVRMLIDAGAKKDIENIEGGIPYDLAQTEEMKNLLKP